MKTPWRSPSWKVYNEHELRNMRWREYSGQVEGNPDGLTADVVQEVLRKHKREVEIYMTRECEMSEWGGVVSDRDESLVTDAEYSDVEPEHEQPQGEGPASQRRRTGPRNGEESEPQSDDGMNHRVLNAEFAGVQVVMPRAVGRVIAPGEEAARQQVVVRRGGTRYRAEEWSCRLGEVVRQIQQEARGRTG